MKFVQALIATTAFVAVSSATAAPTTVTVVGANFGSAPKISMSSGAHFSTVNDYEWIIKSSAPGGTFAAFCLDPFQRLSSPWVYENGSSFTTYQKDALSKVFTGGHWESWNYKHDGVTTAIERAALGLAAWEIYNDTSGVFDFSKGSFRVSDDGFGGAALLLADSFYAAGNTSMASSLIHLSDSVKQDLVIAVPEPTTYALMMAGLLSVGFLARRRRND